VTEQAARAEAVVADAIEIAQPRWPVGRTVLLLVTGICLYLFAPSIAEVFAAWDRLGQFHPLWLAAILGCEILSFACVWALQMIALRTDNWFAVATTQLAGNAFNRVTPGGGATGTALQVRMLGDVGFDTTQAAYALTAQSLLITAVVVAMPIFALPAVIAGTQVPGGLVEAAWIGAAVFVVMVVAGALLLATRRPVCWLGSTIERIANVIRPGRPPIRDLGDRMLRERDQIRATMGSRWLAAVAAAIGRWGFEYLALLLALYAISARPDPWLVLFAFVAASALGLLPFTPGGLGFVEAGLTATLALAGIHPEEAALATLVYRLFSFWLPLPVGIVATFIFRRRYPREHRAPAQI
jgi:uncharacterized protein (TIRG00374 family)